MFLTLGLCRDCQDLGSCISLIKCLSKNADDISDKFLTEELINDVENVVKLMGEEQAKVIRKNSRDIIQKTRH